MIITTMRNKVILRAEEGMWITNDEYTIFSKQVVCSEASVSDFFEITEEEKQRLLAEQGED